MSEAQSQPSKLDHLAGSLNAALLDEFSREVLKGSLMAFKAVDNPLRLSQFSTGIRELIGHTLATLATDNEVKAASWFQVETQDGRPTRRQRVKFAIQGGMSDLTITDLQVDTAEIDLEVRKVVDELSKYTHVRPDTLRVDPEEAEVFCCDALATFLEFFEILDDCRKSIRRAVENGVDEHALEVFTQDVYNEIDILSTRSSVDAVQIDKIEVVAIGSAFITYGVSGQVYVDLSYGSKSDFRNDMGAEISTDFPFSMTTMAPVGNIGRFENPTAQIDTSSWYGDDDDEGEDLFLKITDY
ncbi:pPIWI-associating nuclease domain-containing protein [Rhizobium anhuiense]